MPKRSTKNGTGRGPTNNDDHKEESDGRFSSERYLHSHKYPAFDGVLEFDLTFELYGHCVTRQARATYTFTPDWEYFDLVKNALYVGWAGSTMDLEVLAIPSDGTGDDEPEWVEVNDLCQLGVFSHAMGDAIDGAIEQQCRVEDAERRNAAGKRKK